MRILTCMLLIVASAYASANQAFYFIAKQAPEASLTTQGNQSQVVYLRWDVVEGKLPSDIVSFALYRDGNLIGEYPAHQLMSESQVKRLYQTSSQSRRLLETMALLKEESVRSSDLAEVDANNFANEILMRIQHDEYWAQLSSKRDFNIAMARHRATIDRPGQGVFSYELRAVDAQSQSRRVGLVQVDTNVAQNLLPIPNFMQLSLSQCDLPDIKDHYSVALNWSSASDINMADRMANQLFISGYDLYRSTENLAANLSQAPVRDLASEARRQPYDHQGQIVLDGLERVNSTLLTLSPDANLNNPEWLETPEDLENAGIKPGDKRAYYIVARDFTGNFGPTAATLVTVGDMSRPPMPWDVDIYLSEENQRVELSFEKIDADSYLESFGASKRVCGISESGAISFVSQDESCAQHRHKIIQSEVKEYLVYRFDNFAEASRFKDSDGDGFSDRSERPSNTQCIAADQSGDSLIKTSEEQISYDNHTRIILADEEPAANKGLIYWYRLAAKSPNGRLSFLSEPLRVNFPDRNLPPPPVVNVSYPGDGSQTCGCELDYQDNQQAWSFSIDSELGNGFRLRCNGNDYPGLSDPPFSSKDIATGSSLLCNIPNLDINPISQDCALGGQVTTNAQNFSCSVALPQGTDFCETGSMRIRAIACDSVPAPPGIVQSPITIETTAANPAHCTSLYQQVAGESIKVSSNCGKDTLSDIYVIEKGEFCGFAVTHDKNNNISSSTRIECREAIDPHDEAPMLSPRIDTLNLGEDFASLNLALPTQKQSFVEVELQRSLPTESGKLITRVGIASATENITTVNFDIPPLTYTSDQWCVRARIHGPSERVGQNKISSWSKMRCDVRASSSETLPKWLSWPGLKVANQQSDLVALNNDAFGFVLNTSPLSVGIHIPLLKTENPCATQANGITLLGEVEQAPMASGPALVDIRCASIERSQMIASYAPELNFLVFRQSRLNGETTHFKQVSPLISFAHWGEFRNAKNTTEFRLRDPYIWASVDDMADPLEVNINFVDRAPLMSGREYRYQFVYFDGDHAMVSWRQSNWIAYDTEQSMQFAGGKY